MARTAKPKDEKVTQIPVIDTRYPYTYACDLIRIIAGMKGMDAKLSRSDASQIRELFAKVTGIDDETLATMLADHYKKHKETIESEAYQKILYFITKD